MFALICVASLHVDQYHYILRITKREWRKGIKKLQRYVQEQVDDLTDAMRIIVCPSSCGGGTIGLRGHVVMFAGVVCEFPCKHA